MLCCSELPTLEKGYKKTTKKELLSPSERHTKGKKKPPDITRGSKSNDTAHYSIITAFTVLV